MRLKPYHNPRNVDESKVPKGWRFRYADEMSTKAQRAKYWSTYPNEWHWSFTSGIDRMATYIVPVKS